MKRMPVRLYRGDSGVEPVREWCGGHRPKTPDEPHLAQQVPTLQLACRCRCGDDFCSTFYTETPPNGSYGPGHRNVVLDSSEGMVVPGIVEERIVCVEVLRRNDIRQRLLELLP